MIQISLQGVAAGVASAPDGQKILSFHDAASGIVVTVPLDEQGADQLAKALRGTGLHVASGLPAALQSGSRQ